MNNYTKQDMLDAFEKWKNLDRSGKLGPDHDDEVKKQWIEYCKIRDWLAKNNNQKELELE